MDLNDLLSEIEGIGVDRFVASTPTTPAAPPPPVPTEPAEAPTAIPAVTPPAAAALTEDYGALEMVLDVELDLQVELGATRMPLRSLIALTPGDTIRLPQGGDDALKIYVNDRLIALGEALIVDGALAVRVTELLPPTTLMGARA